MRACPFCGGERMKTTSRLNEGRPWFGAIPAAIPAPTTVGYVVECEGCGAQGPVDKGDPVGARLKWDERVE